MFRRNACAIIAVMKKLNELLTIYIERTDIMKPELRQRISGFIDRNKALFLLSYFAIYLPWFGHLEKTVTTHFHVIHTALDDYIPFCEYFIIPYLLWFGTSAGASVISI